MNVRILPILAMFLVAPQAFASEAVAQEDVDALYKIVMRLTNRISDLETQVKELEGRESRPFNQQQSRANAPIPNASSKAWHNPANWSRLKVGMSEARVKQILGEPSRRGTSYIGSVTLTYSGFNSNGVSLTGNVELFKDDQIGYEADIKPPAW